MTEQDKDFLAPEEFQKKYNTTYKQKWPESKLEEVSEDDRASYTDTEILTGRMLFGARLNKFCNNGYNRGKKYDTTKQRMITNINKFVDDKIANDEFNDWLEKAWQLAMDGDARYFKEILNRVAGKVTEEIKIEQEGEINFVIDPTKLFDTNEEEEEED